MSPKHPNCVAIEADLVAAATGEAAPPTAQRVQEHVNRCAPCLEDFGRYQAIEGVVGRMRTAPAVGGGEAHARERLAARLSELRRRLVSYGIFPSPLGHILIARSEDGVSLVEYLGDARDVSASRLGRGAGVDAMEDAAALEAFYRELLEYLEGRRTHLEWPLDLRLARSDFHRSVLRATADIPYGAVRSYAGIAYEVGKPTATRAVATLPGESAYCLPTCQWIPTAEHPHRLIFFGARARAEAAGLTPCSDCRPDLHPLAS